MIFEAPITSPWQFFNGEIFTATGMPPSSFATRMVCKPFDGLLAQPADDMVHFIQTDRAGTAPLPALPTISSADNQRAARPRIPGLNHAVEILVKIASPEISTTAARCAAVRLQFAAAPSTFAKHEHDAEQRAIRMADRLPRCRQSKSPCRPWKINKV